jgi:hypothetical protein
MRDFQFARLAGQLAAGHHGMPASAVKIAVNAGHNAHQAQMGAQQMARARGAVGDMQAFVQAEAARRRGQNVPLPVGFEPVMGGLEDLWQSWAPEGDMSLVQIKWLVDALQTSAVMPSQQAKAIKTIHDQKDSASTPAIRGKACMTFGKLLEQGRLGRAPSYLGAAWYYHCAKINGLEEGQVALERLDREHPEGIRHLASLIEVMVLSQRIVIRPGRWQFVQTNFGAAPMHYVFDLGADDNCSGETIGMGDGLAKNMLDAAIGVLAPFGDAIENMMKAKLHGRWKYLTRLRLRPTSDTFALAAAGAAV